MTKLSDRDLCELELVDELESIPLSYAVVPELNAQVVVLGAPNVGPLPSVMLTEYGTMQAPKDVSKHEHSARLPAASGESGSPVFVDGKAFGLVTRYDEERRLTWIVELPPPGVEEPQVFRWVLAAIVLAGICAIGLWVWRHSNLPSAIPPGCTRISDTFVACPYEDNWDGARWRCQSYGMDLASIHSQHESEQLASSLLSVSHDRVWWIGFTDRAAEGTFRWADGSVVDYTNWFVTEDNREPNDTNRREDCAVLWGSIPGWAGSSRWNDVDCDSLEVSLHNLTWRYGFICR